MKEVNKSNLQGEREQLRCLSCNLIFAGKPLRVVQRCEIQPMAFAKLGHSLADSRMVLKVGSYASGAPAGMGATYIFAEAVLRNHGHLRAWIPSDPFGGHERAYPRMFVWEWRESGSDTRSMRSSLEKLLLLNAHRHSPVVGVKRTRQEEEFCGVQVPVDVAEEFVSQLE